MFTSRKVIGNCKGGGWGRGSQKPKLLMKYMRLNWNFQRGCGGGDSNQKTFCGEGMNIFCNNTSRVKLTFVG